MHHGDFGNLVLIMVAAMVIVALIRASSRGRGGRAGRSGQRVCSACGAAHPPFAQFCRRCGQRLQDKVL